MLLYAEQEQKLFNYFAQEHNVMLLDSDFREIENIISDESFPFDADSKPEDQNILFPVCQIK